MADMHWRTKALLPEQSRQRDCDEVIAVW